MSKGRPCPTSSSTENSPGGLVETETGETDGSDWGPGDNVTVTEEGEEGGKGREGLHMLYGYRESHTILTNALQTS